MRQKVTPARGDGSQISFREPSSNYLKNGVLQRTLVGNLQEDRPGAQDKSRLDEGARRDRHRYHTSSASIPDLESTSIKEALPSSRLHCNPVLTHYELSSDLRSKSYLTHDIARHGQPRTTWTERKQQTNKVKPVLGRLFPKSPVDKAADFPDPTRYIRSAHDVISEDNNPAKMSYGLHKNGDWISKQFRVGSVNGRDVCGGKCLASLIQAQTPA